ncbi:MAG: hypothetical protein Q8K82_14190 [Gemmatimonadaceae bacterium]|nr:hypothetical protein [Gemmatimonadaceae bacterium]
MNILSIGLVLAAGVMNTLTAAIVTVSLVAPRLGAQARDTTSRADSARSDTLTVPFVRGGIYDKPFTTRLAGRTAIGGYAEAHARYQRVDGLPDESGFEAKRFNLFVNTRVSDVVRLAAELEFEDGGRDISIEFAAVDLRIHSSFTLRGGMLLSPLGRFNLSHDSPMNEFTDRPLVSTEVLGVALSEPGFGAFGQFSAGGRGRLTYELYATNGFNDGLITASAEGTRIPLGRDNLKDNNGSPALVGRLAWSPRAGYEIGFSAHRGAYNVFNQEGAAVDERRDVTISVVDAEATVVGVRLTAEAALAHVDVPAGLTGIYSSNQRGFFAEAVRDFGRGWVRTIPASVFALKARVDVVDFDTDLIGQSTSQLSVGVNFRPTQDSVVKLDYVRGRGRDRFNNLGEHAFLLASVATYF